MGTTSRCPHSLTGHDPIRANECTCCGRYMAEFWLCADCDDDARSRRSADTDTGRGQ